MLKIRFILLLLMLFTGTWSAQEALDMIQSRGDVLSYVGSFNH